MTNKVNSEKTENNEIQLFIQGEGVDEIQLVRIHDHLTLRELIGKLPAVFAEITVPAAEVTELIFLLEDSERELPLDKPIKDIGIKHRGRIHIHRCRKVKVSVSFNGKEINDAFPPSRTIGKIKQWADKHFDISGVDATEHALQICGSAKRPDEDTHLGSLVHRPNCQICFDLVPKKRVEGEE